VGEARRRLEMLEAMHCIKPGDEILVKAFDSADTRRVIYQRHLHSHLIRAGLFVQKLSCVGCRGEGCGSDTE